MSTAAAPITAASVMNAQSLSAEIEISQTGREESTTAPAGVVSPQMSRTDDSVPLRGGGFQLVTACPLMDDNNWCRFRCCCCDQGCTKFVLMCQWYCIKCGPGGLKIEKGCPLASNENFCRMKCLCVDGGCRKLELTCQNDKGMAAAAIRDPLPTTGVFFPVYVKSLTGAVHTLLVTAAHTVSNVKTLYEVPTGIPEDCQRFIFAGKRLEDGRTMQHYNIQRDSTLHVVLRLRDTSGLGCNRPLLLDMYDTRPAVDAKSAPAPAKVAVVAAVKPVPVAAAVKPLAPSAATVLHPEIRNLREDRLHAALLWSAKDQSITDIEVATPGVYRLSLFTPVFRARLIEAAQHYATQTGTSVSNLNSFDIGFKPFLNDLVERYMAPLLPLMFPALIGKNDRLVVGSSHFIQTDAASADKDFESWNYVDPKTGRSTAAHTDSSDVTINMCLGGDFTGSELVFGADAKDGGGVTVHQHTGEALIHAGAHVHDVKPIRSGKRTNWIIWIDRADKKNATGGTAAAPTAVVVDSKAAPNAAPTGNTIITARMQTLLDMGFPLKSVIQACRETDGQPIQIALNWFLKHCNEVESDKKLELSLHETDAQRDARAKLIAESLSHEQTELTTRRSDMKRAASVRFAGPKSDLNELFTPAYTKSLLQFGVIPFLHAPRDRARMMCVNRRWRDIARESLLWSVLHCETIDKAHYMAALKGLKNVKSISLDFSKLAPKQFRDILTACPLLESFSAQVAGVWDAKAVAALLQLCPNLKSVDLTGISFLGTSVVITDDVTAGGKYGQKLERLFIRGLDWRSAFAFPELKVLQTPGSPASTENVVLKACPKLQTVYCTQLEVERKRVVVSGSVNITADALMEGSNARPVIHLLRDGAAFSCATRLIAPAGATIQWLFQLVNDHFGVPVEAGKLMYVPGGMNSNGTAHDVGYMLQPTKLLSGLGSPHIYLRVRARGAKVPVPDKS